ncbi:hypothetical protein HVX64_23535 (plasmid) [Citrobacter sp. RHB20-C16]|nr:MULTISPECIES: hypothetical protein [Citrobacter]QMK80805.1 hypothetical protein HVX64_23535 [Citrobacter sp. RHB20-C16]QMK85404.1 hypothetical protein HVX63_23460 [Citrobacter sp. RHB20-C15]HED1792738.1 hypothetical protein [Citrobacter amalonaticus]
MIPYISLLLTIAVLSLVIGAGLGYMLCIHQLKQQLKTKTLRVGKRVYRVVHETGVVK